MCYQICKNFLKIFSIQQEFLYIIPSFLGIPICWTSCMVKWICNYLLINVLIHLILLATAIILKFQIQAKCHITYCVLHFHLSVQSRDQCIAVCRVLQEFSSWQLTWFGQKCVNLHKFSKTMVSNSLFLVEFCASTNPTNQNFITKIE